MSTEIKAVTHTEKVIAGEVNAVTHLEKVIAEYGGGGGGGGFTPTTAQLAAMNSGIDSEKVAQVETKETNILTIETVIDNNKKYLFSPVGNLTIIPNKLINNKNQVRDYNDAAYTIVTYRIPDGTKQLAVTASANFGNRFYVITGNSVVRAASETAASGANISTITEEIVDVPPEGKYITVANIISPATPYQQIYNIDVGIGANNWNNKKWVAVGDSLTEVNSRANMHYYDYIVAKTGVTVVNFGVGGTGYKRGEDNSEAFYQRIANIPTDADIITIFGSGNDLNYTAMGFNDFTSALGNVTDTTTSTICGCINATIDTIWQLCPTANIGIVTPTPWANYNPANNGNDMDLYSNAIITICKNKGIPCLDLYHCSNLRPWDSTFRAIAYSNDEGNGVHPDSTGHAIIAPRFMAFLENLIL
jgi:lysophospholipase L1-like esterase